MKTATLTCHPPAGFATAFSNFLFHLLLLNASLSLLFFAHPKLALAMDSFKIGLLPEMNVFKQMERYQPLVECLSSELGLKAEIVMLNNYGNIIERLDKHEVNAAFLGSFTGALAITQLHVEPLARPLFQDGTSTYFGKIFVRKDSAIRSIADMKGKTLALVNTATTAGYLFPLALIRQNGIPDLNSYFKEVFFTGSHDASIRAVFEGKADVGAAKNTIFERMLRKEPALGKGLLVLKNSSVVPSNGFCVCHGVPESLKNRLKETLLHLQENQKGKAALAKLGALRFVETTREDYQPVIDMANQAGIDITNYPYQDK